MPASAKKIQWINSLKGVCILLVVLNHIITTSYIPSLSVINQHQFITKVWVGINHYLVPLRMPAFSLFPVCWPRTAFSYAPGMRY
ncbi:hypothetical protein GTU79_15795 [Sodalis ligni]|uniref:hypothetical protein n=1 Tax=Sodalis ligni TaxID=2697027 RepID=UPI001BDE8FB1|nr:hypothetical protein [Sodalis ligni]QWA08977.1 hypothetical protein GTU79_15795 [Sodalis ligni]